MLIDEPQVRRRDPILSMIASVNGNDPAPQLLKPGIVLIGHFGSSAFLPDYEPYPSFGDERGPYGVCDNADQLLAKYPELEADPFREYTVTLTEIKREAQSPDGGWRWHKWGAYIGTQNPEHEYIYDDTHIDVVYVFHIYERKA